MLVKRGVHCVRSELAFERLHYDAHWQFIFLAKLQVTLIVRWDRHNCARAVLHQHEIPDPDGNLFVVERINCIASGEEAFLLHGRQIFGLDRGLAHLRQLRLRFGACGRTFEKLGHERMRGRKNDRRRPVNRVNARGENLNWSGAGRASHGKSYFRALRFADPILLHQDDTLWPSTFELLQIVKQLIGISCGFQEPLFNFARFHARVFMTPAEATVDHLLVS